MAPTNVGVAHNVGMKQRNILLIDDHAMVREGLRLLLTANPRLRCVIQEASTLAQGLQILNESPTIDWILLDLGLPDVDGLAALETLRARHEQIPVVVLTSAKERSLVLACINAGAMGFISKASNSSELTNALLHVFAGGIYLPPQHLGVSDAPPVPPDATALASRAQLLALSLTPRQVDVVELVVQGLSNKLIARRLGLAEATVKSHLVAGFRALNVRNRTQAVIALARRGYGVR